MVINSIETIELELKICNFYLEAKNIDLHWKMPEGWQIVERGYKSISTSPWSEQNIIIHLKPLNARAGEYYAIQIDGTAEGRMITPVLVRVQVVSNSQK